MLRGTCASEGRTTLPSGLCLHFPNQMASSITSHSQMKWPETPQKLQTLVLVAFIPTKAAPKLFSLLPTYWFCRMVLNISERPVIAMAKASSFTLVKSSDATGFVNAVDPMPWASAIVAKWVPILIST